MYIYNENVSRLCLNFVVLHKPKNKLRKKELKKSQSTQMG